MGPEGDPLESDYLYAPYYVMDLDLNKINTSLKRGSGAAVATQEREEAKCRIENALEVKDIDHASRYGYQLALTAVQAPRPGPARCTPHPEE